MKNYEKIFSYLMVLVYISYLINPIYLLHADPLSEPISTTVNCDSIDGIDKIKSICSDEKYKNNVQMIAQCGAFKMAYNAIIQNGIMESLSVIGVAACCNQCALALLGVGMGAVGTGELTCGVSGMLTLGVVVSDLVVMSQEAKELTANIEEAKLATVESAVAQVSANHTASTAGAGSDGNTDHVQKMQYMMLSQGAAGVPATASVVRQAAKALSKPGAPALPPRAYTRPYSVVSVNESHAIIQQGGTTYSVPMEEGPVYEPLSARAQPAQGESLYAPIDHPPQTSIVSQGQTQYSVPVEEKVPNSFNIEKPGGVTADVVHELPPSVTEEPRYSQVNRSPSHQTSAPVQNNEYTEMQDMLKKRDGMIANNNRPGAEKLERDFFQTQKSAKSSSSSISEGSLAGPADSDQYATIKSEEGNYSPLEGESNTDAGTIKTDKQVEGARENAQNTTKEQTVKAEERAEDSKAMPCAMCALNVAMSTVIGVGLAETVKARNDACQAIANQDAISPSPATSPNAHFNEYQLNLAVVGIRQIRMAINKITQTIQNLFLRTVQAEPHLSAKNQSEGPGVLTTADTIQQGLEQYLDGNSALAQQGGFAAQFAKRYPPTPNVVMPFLEESGITLNEISKQAISGHQITEWLRANPNIPPELLEKLKKIEEQAKQGHIKVKGFSVFSATSADDKKLTETVQLPTIAQVKVQKKMHEYASVTVEQRKSNEAFMWFKHDIWHLHSTESLFGIVSDRITESYVRQTIK